MTTSLIDKTKAHATTHLHPNPPTYTKHQGCVLLLAVFKLQQFILVAGDSILLRFYSPTSIILLRSVNRNNSP